jgi:hypothetical protein
MGKEDLEIMKSRNNNYYDKSTISSKLKEKILGSS